jgi:hypothetical protein
MSEAESVPPAEVPGAPAAEIRPPVTPDVRGEATGPVVDLNLRANDINAGRDQNFIAHQRIIQVAGSYVEEELFAPERPFSADDASPLEGLLADELCETFVGDDTLLAKLKRHLEQSRILLLTGDRDIGKRTVALYLGYCLTEKRTLVVESLERRVAIDLGRLAADGDHFASRAMVFIDAFDRHNRQLRSFFTGGNTIRWKQLTERLRDHGSYLIFTSISEHAPFGDAATHVAHHLQAPTSDVIKTAIDQRLAWLRRQSEVAAARLTILEEQRHHVVEELKTLSRIASFVNRFVRDDTDLDLALTEFRKVPYWFRTALDQDASAWTFVLTLTLAQPSRDARSAPWADFERLRRAIAERLRGDAEFTVRRNNKSDVSDETERTITQSFCDDLLLARCRAISGKDADRLGDVVQFEHPSLLPELWQTLLCHHRRALMAVLPVLVKLADENEEWSTRVLAAQAIGRIGEIDPRRIAVPLLQRWSSSGDRTRRPLVGRMMQGVLGSANEVYREFMLTQIRTLARTATNEDPREPSNALLTAIGAYSQIGVYDSARAMKHLGEIVTDFLAPIVENVHALGRAVETVDTILSEGTSRRAARGLIHRRFQLSRVADSLLEAQAPALVAVEQTIVQLCFAHNPIDILRKMRDWSSKGGSATATLVALLFLYDGIADDLQGLPLVYLSTSDDVHQLCALLADLHQSISGTFRFAASLQRELREKFDDCLIGWARDGAGDQDLKATVISVFVALVTVRGGVMKETILGVLQNDAFQEDRAMRSLAQDIHAGLRR